MSTTFCTLNGWLQTGTEFKYVSEAGCQYQDGSLPIPTQTFKSKHIFGIFYECFLYNKILVFEKKPKPNQD